ncbi:MAG TPA: NAD(P)-dependent oxidoreductase [Actinopolymorphaceae bacterium]|nr:NAD(P)-dependent oxidoreductase [Actinopolymorphaceae bacterium]
MTAASTGQPEGQTVLITGGAGRIGRYLWDRLRRPGRTIRVFDTKAPDASEIEDVDGVEYIVGSVTDFGAVHTAMSDVDAVIHLAGIASTRAAASDLTHVNITGTAHVFEAACQQGVRRIVFASSNHAAGFGERHMAGGAGLPRPDSYYGVTKVFGEVLGSLYHDRNGIDVVCLRIGTCRDHPTDVRSLGTWLSPDDAGRLVEAALSHPAPGFVVAWGVSDNRRRPWPLDAARALGFRPEDDGEAFAEQIDKTDQLAHTASPSVEAGQVRQTEER